MEEIILDELRRDVFEKPKASIDLEYLYSVRRQVQDFAHDTNAQLKKNVYQNYSLFIESSREISTLKDEMRQLNTLLEQQQSSMSKLLDQLNKAPIIQPTLERLKIDPFRLELSEETSEVEAEILPSWFTKSPEDFDVLIAQRNLREAVELAKRVKSHLEQYPKCYDNQPSLKIKIEARLRELVDAICSELQPATDRSVQGGPRSSITSIQLLRELNLSSRAVKLYLDHRTSVLRFVLGQQKMESTTSLQFIKQICSIFFHNIVETCNEFKQAFELNRFVDKATKDSTEKLSIEVDLQSSDQMRFFDLVRPIYSSEHPSLDAGSPNLSNGNDISSHLLSHHADKIASHAMIAQANVPSRGVFYNLSTYSSLTYWTLQEFESFISLFKRNVFNSSHSFQHSQQPLNISMVAEGVYHLRGQCVKMADHCELDLSKYIEQKLEKEIRQVIEDCGRKLIETINKLDSEEQWQPQQFQNQAQLTRFLEEMSDVDLKTMSSYLIGDLKLHFTACKTSFARYFLITVSDLAKLINPETKANKDHIDSVLGKAFEIEMSSVIKALEKAKERSRLRFIKGNSNFLLDKVIVEAGKRYKSTTGLSCQRLVDLRAKYQEKADAIAKV